MKLIRENVFETNSSSTHALVIAHNVKDEDYELYDSLDHEYQFGREGYRLVEYYDEKLAYIYYVLKNLKNKSNDQDIIEQFKGKVRGAYKRVIQLTGHEPYRSEPTPDDIFNLIDLEFLDEYSLDYNGQSKTINFLYDYDGDKPVIVCPKSPEATLTGYRGEISIEINGEQRIATKDDLVYVTPTDKQLTLIRLNEILSDYIKSGSAYYSKSVYVDHSEDYRCNGFIEKIIDADIDLIMKLIFNRACYITVGGDEYWGYNIKTIGFEHDYDSSKEYQVNEKGERCPDRSEFPDTDEGWDKYWTVVSKYNITRDDGGFWDKLREYEKDHDVFLKGN